MMTNAIFESRKENSIERMRCEASACLTYAIDKFQLVENSPLLSRRRSVFLFFVTSRARSL